MDAQHAEAEPSTAPATGAGIEAVLELFKGDLLPISRCPIGSTGQAAGAIATRRSYRKGFI